MGLALLLLGHLEGIHALCWTCKLTCPILLFVSQAYYYCAIVEDVILRFAWTIQISLTSMQIFPSAGDIISTVFAPLEVFR